MITPGSNPLPLAWTLSSFCRSNFQIAHRRQSDVHLPLILMMDVPLSLAASIQRPSKRRNKSFTGCWTCRERRVKCDQARPSCKRCNTAGISCQGYGIRLVWKALSSSADEKTNARRRATRPTNSHRSILSPSLRTAAQPLTKAEICSIQNNLNGLRADARPPSHECFSVFYAQSTTGSAESQQSSPKSEALFISSSPSTVASPLNDNPSEDEPLEILDYPIAGEDTVSQADCHSSYSLPMSIDGDLGWDTSLLLAPDNPSLSSCDDFSSTTETSDILSLRPPSAQLRSRRPDPKPYLSPALNAIPTATVERELLHHFANTLHFAMSPVISIDLLQNSLFLPMAMAGLGAGTHESTGEAAVFHGICAASAFNLARLKGPNQDEHLVDVGVKHRQLSLHHLRQSVQDSRQIQKLSTWAAILTFLIQGGVRGEPHEWREHANGLSSLILANTRMIQESWMAKSIYESCVCIMVLGNTHTEVELRPLLAEIRSGLEFVGPCHGLTKPLLDIILGINSLAASKPFLSPDLVDRLELQLLAFSPSNIAVDGLEENSARLLVAHVHIYYYAAVIHLQRVLRGRRPDMLQELVLRGVEHMEAAEAITGPKNGCIWVWPCLVIAAEATSPPVQHRIEAWFKQKRRYGFANMDVAGMVAQEVWRRRDQRPKNQGDICWQNLVLGSQYDVLPL